MPDDIDEIMDVLIAHGFVKDVGRNQKGEIIYEMTEEGKKHVDFLRKLEKELK